MKEIKDPVDLMVMFYGDTLLLDAMRSRLHDSADMDLCDAELLEIFHEMDWDDRYKMLFEHLKKSGRFNDFLLWLKDEADKYYAGIDCALLTDN